MPAGTLELVDQTFPFHLGALEVDQLAHGFAGGFQIVQTLGCVFFGEPVHAFQFHHEHSFDQKIGIAIPDMLTLVPNGQGGLCDYMDSAKLELVRKGSLVDFFEEANS